MTASLFSPDNVDRMLIKVAQESFLAEPWRQKAPVLIVHDATGALSQWARDQELDIRFIQDSAGLASEHKAVTGPVSTFPSAEDFANVSTVLYRLARPLEALEEFSWQAARWAAPDVLLLAGQLQRHLNFSMNRVLQQYFHEVSASRGYHKARALRARAPKLVQGSTPPRMPRRNVVEVAGESLHLRAHGMTFGAARVDPGTRLLLETLADGPINILSADSTVVDLGCGNGTIAAVIAKLVAPRRLIASDDSASAVRSTTATLAVNSIVDVEVMHQSGLVQLPEDSVDAVILNPPFHDGTQLTWDIAFFLFEEAARVLKPGGILWTVFNASRNYRAQLTRRVGPTWQLARDARFIVTQTQKAEKYD